MTKDNRASMFNRAQARDLEEKQKTIEAQEKSDDDDGIRNFTVRIPALIHVAMQQERAVSGESMNSIVVEALTERYPEDSFPMKMARMILDENGDL